MGISPMQLMIILVIVALIFGTKKLRNMGGDLGGAVKGFKSAMKDENAKPLEKNNSLSSEAKADAVVSTQEKDLAQ